MIIKELAINLVELAVVAIAMIAVVVSTALFWSIVIGLAKSVS